LLASFFPRLPNPRCGWSSPHNVDAAQMQIVCLIINALGA
jgi:hypothetical protein